MRLEGRAPRAFFCSGSRVGCRGARDNSREFARDTRATTEMPEMATTDQATALQVYHSRWACRARPSTADWQHVTFRIGRSRVIS